MLNRLRCAAVGDAFKTPTGVLTLVGFETSDGVKEDQCASMRATANAGTGPLYSDSRHSTLR